MNDIFGSYVKTVFDKQALERYIAEDGVDYIIAIGDLTTERYRIWFDKLPEMVIIDGRANGDYPTPIYLRLKGEIDKTVVKNLGSISYELIDYIFEKTNKREKCKIYVVGEEDDALYPTLLFADDRMAIISGDPRNERMIYIKGGLTARVLGWSQITTKKNGCDSDGDIQDNGHCDH